MDQKIIDFNKSQARTDIPEIRTGDVVCVYKKIKEGEKERIQQFKGLVIAIKGRQSSSPTITVRKDSQGIGVEMVLPIYLPSIEKIEVLRHSKIRQAKLYYMRERAGRSAKMKIRDFSEKEKTALKEKDEKAKAEKAEIKEKSIATQEEKTGTKPEKIEEKK